ncbi:MAG: MFS transporter [Defluviitaleaceae bacterium]|nr:MFS transporter [Defluviitaleaceae bacterium]
MKDLFKTNKMFRLLLWYQFFSGLGGGVFSFFMLFSVHMLYRNPIYTGIAGFLMSAPFIFAFAVGPVIDRRNKVTIMRLTTFLEFAVLAMLVVTPFQERLGVMFMFAVIFIYSLAALFEAPAGTALLPNIVAEDKIMEANSLIQIISITGGIVIAIVLFVIMGDTINNGYADSGSFISFELVYGISAGFLALALLFAILLRCPSAQVNGKPAAANYLRDLREGAKFLRHNVLFYITIAMVAKSFVIEVAYISMPAFAEYHVGAQGYVVLTVISMAGVLAASFLVGLFGKRFRVGQLLLVVTALQGGMRILFVFILPEQYYLGLGVHFLFSALGAASGVVVQTLGQKIPPKDMVGRVNTISTTFAAIFVAIGALAGGLIGNVVPVVDHIFIYQGIAYVIIGIFIISIPSIRKLPKVNEIGDNKTEDTTSIA